MFLLFAIPLSIYFWRCFVSFRFVCVCMHVHWHFTTFSLRFPSFIKVTILTSCNAFKCIRYLTRCKAVEAKVEKNGDILILNGVDPSTVFNERNLYFSLRFKSTISSMYSYTHISLLFPIEHHFKVFAILLSLLLGIFFPCSLLSLLYLYRIKIPLNEVISEWRKWDKIHKISDIHFVKNFVWL